MPPSNLSETSRNILKDLSETGMGYQQIWSGDKSYLVLNNKYAFEWNDYFSKGRFYILEIRNLLKQYAPLVPFNLTSIALVPNPSSTPTKPTGTVVPPPFIYTTQPGDIFYRLSSFQNDHCILNATDFRPNSYAITASDKNEVPSGLAAVARYALPSRLSHIHIWELQPPANTQVYVGTVIPNYGMSGGGVEAFFPNGIIGGTINKLRNLLEL